MSNSFPPEGYVQTKSAVSGIEVYRPLKPEELEEARPVVDFRCPNCDGATAYSADNGGLTCTFCGYHEAPQVEIVGKGAQEFEFTVETVERSTNGWGQERKELVCSSCASHITLSSEMLSHTCPFCGSNAVVQTRAPQDVLRPRFLVPFVTTTENCRQITAEFLQKSWMLPNNLQNLARSTEYTPIYIPFWTFDARTQATWRAEVYNTDASRRRHSAPNWKWERPFLLKLGDREGSQWDWESGAVSLVTDDMLVSGSSQISLTLLKQLRGYRLGELVPYEPTFLAGLSAQAYDVDLETAWASARRSMRAKTKDACQEQASARNMRNFSMNLDFSDESWRYILLPIYLANYRYGNKVFQVLINGQTGTIAGQRPVDWRKVAKVLGLWFLPGLLLAIASAVLLANENGIGGAIMLAAGFAMLAWIIFAIITVSKAGKMADA
ncbi:MAG: hypothetical protein H6654_14695 [Ardenticatenaceae bacterium]|nr:hypothetical protein [Anaerolineales bacterium]MCB8939048.1 hypothetical protein [Ardenticatenaceae bacterium]MCB8974804.1 hypothetical protein [Ardenticatenaceae bacterium]